MRKRAKDIIKEQKCNGECFSEKGFCPLIDECELGRRRELQNCRKYYHIVCCSIFVKRVKKEERFIRSFLNFGFLDLALQPPLIKI